MRSRTVLVLSAALLAGTSFLALRGVPGSRRAGETEGARSYATAAERAERKGPSAYPSDWEWLRRTSPHGRVDEAAFRDQVRRARALKAETGYQTHAFALTPVGPDNIGGRFSDVEWHPSDPSVIYAGAATGGVWKSTDGGASFAPIADDALQNLNIGDIAIDRLNPSTVFVGTGEANGGHNNFPGGRVYRSTDAGATWSFVGLGQSVSVGRIVVDPSNSQRVFVAAQGSYFTPNSERGIYRSTNGGDSWTRVLFVSDSTAATDVAIDPANPNRLMAAMWERVRRPNSTRLAGPTSAIWRSLDGGTSWTRLGAAHGLPDAPAQPVGRIGLALCAANPSVGYALINDGFVPIGLWRTTDFGATWTNRDTDQEIRTKAAANFSWYFAQVRVAPDDCNRVYAMDVQFTRSDDGGLSFTNRNHPTLHVDHHALAFHPSDPSAFVEGNDGGLNFSSDAGVTWSKVPGLPVNQFYEIGLDPSNPSRLYGGTQDNGTLRTLTGATDDWERIFGGDGFYVNVDPRDGDVIYAESQFGHLGKTTTGGGTWIIVTPPLDGDRTNWSTPVVLDPSDPDVVYYGSQRLWRSDNGASTWAAVSGDLTNWVTGARLGTITTIGISPVDPAVVWIGTDDGNVWRGVRDGGGVFAWTNVTTGTLPDRWVTRVVAHPTDAQSAWVTFSGLKWVDPEAHVFATTNAGASWADISGNLPAIPINALAVDPAHPTRLFVGTDLGAYFTGDGGSRWQYLHPDLPIASVYDLAIHPTARYLAIGTHGRSMYTLELGAPTAVGHGPPVARAELAPARPNPFRGATTIAFTMPRAGGARLAVYDALGRRVRTLEHGTLSAGRHQRSWDGADDRGRAMPSGRYRVLLELAGGEVRSHGVVLVR